MNEMLADRYLRWLDAVNKCARSGWQCVEQWMFRAPGGTLHDLSAADLGQLKRIEAEGLFIAQDKDGLG